MDVQELGEYINRDGSTFAISNAWAKSWDVLGRYEKPMVAVSGGYDSDIVVDMISRLDDRRKVRYGWHNTGIELEATKRHLRFLEGKYGITIEHLPIVHPISYTVKNYGQPFLSKYVSYCIGSLQKHGYDFRGDSTYERDMQEFYGCKDGLDWWYSRHHRHLWNISNYRYLRDFLVLYPPQFSISDKCCHYSKKLPSDRLQRAGNYDLVILGVRSAEGGMRRVMHNCMMYSKRRGTRFLPILYFSNDDKEIYSKLYGVEKSEAYTVYGFKRTGCSGCPFNPNLFRELEILRKYEPGMARAAEAIFAPSYEYTKLYMQFCEAQYILTGREKERYRLFRH